MNISDLAAGEAKPMNLADLAESPKPMNLKDLQMSVTDRAMQPSGIPIVDETMNQMFKPQTPDQIRQSPVGAVMEYFNKPLNMATAGAVALLEKVTPGIQGQLNPNKEIFPDIVWHDVINYYTPKPEEVHNFLMRNGLSIIPAQALSESYRVARFGLGLASDIVGDPLFAFSPKVGQLSRAGEEAYKVGKFAEAEKNLVSLNYPYSKKPMVEVPLAPVSKAVGQATDAAVTQIMKVPGAPTVVSAAQKSANVASDLVKSFSPWAENPDVNMARVRHTVVQAGDKKYVENFIIEHKEKNFTDSELSVLRNAVEKTPNLALETKLGGAQLPELQSQLTKSVEKIATEQKIPLAPGRAEDLVHSALAIKVENARDIAERIKTGIIDPDNLQVIEGYLVHKASPEAMKHLSKNPAMAAAAEEAGLVKRTQYALNGKTVTTYDSGKYQRTMRKTLDEANEIMKEKTGVASFFIEDPIIATAQKRAETRKFLRDKELLDELSKHATPKSELRRNGIYWEDIKGNQYLEIKHQKFEKKAFLFKTKDGKVVKKTVLEDMVFPKDIAQKVSYDILPRNSGPTMTNVNAFMDSYNRIFRSFALFRPDYYLENWIDNVLKNVVNGVKLDSYVDASRVLMGKDGFVKLANGKQMPLSELKAIVDTFDVRIGNHFSEGLDRVLYTGKKITQEHSLAGKASAAASQGKAMVGNVFRGMHIVGEKGENLTRVAFFVDLLKRGYKPEVAAMEVEKFLFNFQRTTANMDIARRFYQPFIQAALKTAEIAPQIMAKKAWVFNAYENNLMTALQSSFNDPVTSFSVQQLYPEYYKVQDRIAGPLFPANHWLAAMAGYGPGKTQLPYAVALGLPGGFGILNQLMPMFDSQVFKQAESSPTLRAAVTFLSGQDPWTGQQVDIVKGAPEFSKRAQVALTRFVTSAVALPNTEKFLMQKLGITNPQYIEPASVLAWHGMMSKFAKVTNLEKEYFTRLTTLVAAEKELMKKLFGEASKEFQGKTADILFSDKPAARDALNKLTRAYTSAEVWDRLSSGVGDIQTLQMAANNLQAPTPPSMGELVGMIKNIHENVRALNKTYQTAAETYFRAMKGAKEDEIARIRAEMEARSEAAWGNINGAQAQ